MVNQNFRCVICGSITMGRVLTTKIKGDKSQSLCAAECATCGHSQLHPPHYSHDFYEQDSQVQNVIMNYGTQFETLIDHSWIEAQRRFDRFKTQDVILKPSGSQRFNAIDIGGGYGFFACVLAENFPESRVVVLDPSVSRLEKGREIMATLGRGQSLTTSSAFLDEGFAAQHAAEFDLVTMWHVLEHLADPVDLLRNAYRLLRKGGVLCVEVPNLNDELIGLSDAFKDRWFMVEHISYFSPDQLDRCARLAAPNAHVSVKGYQRYGVFNYFHWVYFNKPQGKDPDLFKGTDRLWIETTWRAARETACTSDALFMIVRKP